MTPSSLDLAPLMPIAPMFHVNSWGVPFAGVWMGSKFVFPGQRPHAEDLLKLIDEQQVTFTFGAVTVGIDMMNLLASKPYNIRSLRALMLGGSATPAAVSSSRLGGEEKWTPMRVGTCAAGSTKSCGSSSSRLGTGRMAPE